MVQPKKSGNLRQRGSSSLSALHQRTIAVELEIRGRHRLLVGYGIFERDRNLGEVLRVQFAADEAAEIVLLEGSWRGEIRSGEAAGCDYLIRLS